MSFYGTSMLFDGIPCEEMGLVMYTLCGAAAQSELRIDRGLLGNAAAQIAQSFTFVAPL